MSVAIERLTRERPTTADGAGTNVHVDFGDVILLAPKCPAEIQLGTLRDRRFRVMVPLVVKGEEREGRVVAEATELNEFGFGENFSEALGDLQRAIVELYLTLREDQDRLGPDLQEVWTVLQEKISATL